jgi:hypothetical protein
LLGHLFPSGSLLSCLTSIYIIPLPFPSPTILFFLFIPKSSSLTQHKMSAPAPLRLGSTAPNFQAETTKGNIDFHEFIGDNWVILFSHPEDYTPSSSLSSPSAVSS